MNKQLHVPATLGSRKSSRDTHWIYGLVGPQPGIERQSFSVMPVNYWKTYPGTVPKELRWYNAKRILSFLPSFLPSVSRIRHNGFTDSEL